MTATPIIARYTQIQGVRTFYESAVGTGSAGIIVCLASAGRETRQFHSLMAAFDSEYRVLAFDWPGHGKTWPLPGNECFTSFDDYSGFAGAFIESLAPREQVVLVGCGLGGNVALRLARELPLRAVVAIGTAARYPEISAALLTLLDHPHISQQHAGLTHARSLIGSSAGRQAVEEILWGVCTEVSQVKKAAYGMCSGFDQRVELAAVRCPVLYIRGEEDWLADADAADEIRAALSGCRLETKNLAEVGHFPVQEQPLAVRELVSNFLATMRK